MDELKMSLHTNTGVKRRRINELIDDAITAIWRTEKTSRRGPYGKQLLLQSIYTAYLPLRDARSSDGSAES
jgi:hypothetical protein